MNSSSSPAGTSKMLIKVTLMVLALLPPWCQPETGLVVTLTVMLSSRRCCQTRCLAVMPDLGVPGECRVCSLRFAARFGPGLWPGPRRQARRVGRGLRAQGWVPKMLSAERLERIFGCPCGWRGRHGQCAAFRPGRCDILVAPCATGARVSAWPWCWRARQRDTAGTAGGR